MTVSAHSEPDAHVNGPAKPAEMVVTTLLLAIGMLVAAWAHVYDTSHGLVAAALSLVAALFGALGCWATLALLRTPQEPRAAAAMLAPLAWSVLPLGQLPYVGLFLVSVELVVAASIVRWRVGAIRPIQAFAVAAAARTLAWSAAYALRPALISICSNT